MEKRIRGKNTQAYLCVPSLASQTAELHEVVGEHGADVPAAVQVSRLERQRVLGHGTCGHDGLHHSKVAVCEQLRVLPPLAAHFPQSHVREGPDGKRVNRVLVFFLDEIRAL